MDDLNESDLGKYCGICGKAFEQGVKPREYVFGHAYMSGEPGVGMIRMLKALGHKKCIKKRSLEDG